MNTERVKAQNRAKSKKWYHANKEKAQSACNERRRIAYRSYRDHILRRQRETREWVDSIKLGRPCADCGGSFHPCAMDFDHRDPETKAFTIACSMSRVRAAILAEIDKCDLVCANCHRVRTHVGKGAESAA